VRIEKFKGVLLSTLVIASVVVLIIFALSAKVFANPIPVPPTPDPPILMPEEYIDIELTSIDGVIRAKVDGAYSFWNWWDYDSIDMYYPVPPDSGNISVEWYDPDSMLFVIWPLEWFYSGLMYPTIVGDWPMIQWTIDFAPQNFVIKTHYEHEVPVLDDVYTLVYAMRSGEYAPYWPPYWPGQTTAYVTVRIDFIPKNLKVYAGSEPINYETTVEDGVTILTLTRTSDEFQPFLEDLIITFELEFVSILPSYQMGQLGENLSYTIRVTNIGTENDNYILNLTDTAGWNPTLSENSLTGVQPGESENVTLSVTIPENAASCTEDLITVTATSQADPSVSDNASCIAHAVQPSVEVSISPLSQETLPGGKLEYTVIVKNTGTVLDSYALKASDDQGWTLELADNLLTVPPENTKLEFLPIADTKVDGRDSPDTPRGEFTGLDVTMTADATLLKFDVSSIDISIEDVALKLYCYEIHYDASRSVDLWGVEDDWEEDVIWSGRPAAETGVLVDDVLEGIPSWWTFQSALLTEYVESQRQGDGIVSLALDYGGDGLYASPSGAHYGQNYYSKEADENHPYLEILYPDIFLPNETTLTVTIPQNAVPCTEDNITVTATSQTDNTVENSASCLAYAFSENWEGTAAFSLVNLYTVNVDMTLDIYRGSKLVVKFYSWGDAFESENVIESFTTPPTRHVEGSEIARHPGGTGVMKARLVRTTDDTGNELLPTIASFTVCKLDLAIRFSEIPSYRLLAQTPEERLALAIEFSEIPSYWLLAPSC